MKQGSDMSAKFTNSCQYVSTPPVPDAAYRTVAAHDKLIGDSNCRQGSSLCLVFTSNSLSLVCTHLLLPLLPAEGLRRVTSLPVNHKDIMFYICNTFIIDLHNLYAGKRQSLLISEVQHNGTPEAICKGKAEGKHTCTPKGPKGQQLFQAEGPAGGSLSGGQRHCQQPCCA